MRVHGIWRPRRKWGDARLSSHMEDGKVTLEYFLLPGVEPRRIEAFAEDVLPPLYEAGQRVFFSDDSGTVRSGRLAEAGLHEARFVAREYPGPVSAGPVLLINETGGGKRSLPPEMLEICSDIEIGDPTPVLAAMANEGSWWFHARTDLSRALAKERAVFRGLTGLASASIDIHPHQIQVARRILGDPVCRYILADEVGLGKTIEAGIVIRQHVLESSADFKVLVVGPQHLKKQWESELEGKFGLGAEISLGSVDVCAFRDLKELIRNVWEGDGPEMLVVDEAHHLATLAFSDNRQERELYNLLADLSDRASRVLLLSATPVLRDTAGFLAMLHLLDRSAYDLADLDGFARKVESRDAIASIAYLLSRPVKPMFRDGVLRQVRDVAGSDPMIQEFTEDLANAWELEDDEAAEESRTKLHGHIRLAHQVYRRLIRTRRDDKSVAPDLPSRQFRIAEVASSFHQRVTELLDDWRLALLDSTGEEAHSEEHSSLFATWVALSFDSPGALLDALRDRYETLVRGGQPAFPNEDELLGDHIAVLEDATLSAALPVAEFLATQSLDSNWVVFLSDPDLCTQVSAAVGPRAGVVGAGRHDQGILLVPRVGEEGTNLQGRRASILHADVPLSTVRIEQRIGRMDRLKSANLAVDSVVLSVPDTYLGSWVEATTKAARVFAESVSALQYLIADAEQLLRAELLEHGREAFHRYASMLAASDGDFSLEQEAMRLKRQDVLDSAQVRTNESWFDEIEDYEFEEFEETTDAVKRWLVDGLRFKPLDPRGHTFDSRFDPSHPHRLRVSDRHITLSQGRRWFGGAIARDSAGLPNTLRGRVTEVAAGDRSRALKAAVALTRVGHPLVSGIQEMLRVDDRGRAFAVLIGPPGSDLKPFFRFDIRLEGRPASGDPILIRRTEQALPPLYQTIWLDQEGQHISDKVQRALEAGLKSENKRSIVGQRDWDEVHANFEADWRTLVFGLREVALRIAESSDEWSRRLSAAVDQTGRAKSELTSALRARQSSGQSDAKSDMWGRELYFLDQLEETISAASPEIEALGVVFSTVGSLRST